MGTAATGRIVWVDLTTSDLEGAIHFYERLLGWSFEEQDTDMGAYLLARAGGRDVGGMMAQEPQQAAAGIMPSWTVFIGCDGLERMLARVHELGGDVLEQPIELPDGSRVALVTDPTGAALALAQGPLAERSIVRDEAGAVSWVECQSRDPEVSRRFHEELFGWKSEAGTGGYTVFVDDGTRVAGLMRMPQAVPPEAPSHWLVYFASDAAAACTRAPDLGGAVLTEPMDVEDGTFAVLQDPTGAVFAVFDSQRGG